MKIKPDFGIEYTSELWKRQVENLRIEHTGSDSSSYLTSNVETEEHSTTSDLPHVLTKIDPGGFIENHVRIASERVARTPVRSEIF